MTPKFSLITATVGAALVFAVPAWGDNWASDKSQQAAAVSPDGFERAAAVAVQKHEAMLDARERGLGVVDSKPITDPRHSSLVTRQRALAAQAQPVDARSDGLNRIYGLGEYSTMLDSRERALLEKNGTSAGLPFDPRSDGLNRIYGLGEYADARSVELNRIYGLGEFAPPVVADDRFRIDHTNVPVPVAVTTGRDIEWPQIGIGFGLGFVLIMGLILGLKATRTPPVAH